MGVCADVEIYKYSADLSVITDKMKRVGKVTMISITAIATIVVLALLIYIYVFNISADYSETTGYTGGKHYVSMDGLWRVTPETALKYPHGTLELLIDISGDAYDDFAARGCCIWDDRFYDYWEFDSVHFCDSTRKITIAFNDHGIFEGFADSSYQLIHGIAHWVVDDPSDTSTLDFVRDEYTDITRLFVPYPPGVNGCIAYTYHQPLNYDELQSASVFDYVKDSAAFYDILKRVIRQDFGRIESLLVIKDQKFVLEEYFYGFGRDSLHNIHSCTKSVVSLLLGITLDKHNYMDVDIPVLDFFPQYDSLRTPENEKITLKQVLTMTSGLTEEDDDFEVYTPDDLVKELFSVQLAHDPGKEFRYNNNGTNLLGSVIYSLEQKQADELAKEVLFNKLGIEEYSWEREDGVLHCHSDLTMLPVDMAKIGLLVLNNGVWNGEQVVPREWIEVSTKPQTEESEFHDYGYQWWCRSKDKTPWWSNPVYGGENEHDIFYAMGYGGQFIMVIRDLDMVVVTTSSDNNEETGMWLANVELVVEDIVPLFE